MSTVSPQIQQSDRKSDRELLQQLLRKRAMEGSRTSPLSVGQKALWFLHRSAPKSPAYHVGFTLRIHSPVDEHALMQALQRVVDRHEMLRASFKEDAGQVKQTISGACEVPFSVVDAAQWDGDELHEHVKRAYEQPFDLSRPPLLRGQLFRIDRSESIFLLTVHHLVYDAWSLWLTLEEIGDIYKAEVSSGHAKLGTPRHSYEDFVVGQKEMLDGSQGERLWAYWRNELEGDLTPLNLPIDRPRPSVQQFRGASLYLEVDTDLSARLKNIAREAQVTSFVLLSAAFQVFLHRYTGEEDFLIGTPTGGVDRTRYADVIGYFVNQVPLRTTLRDDPPFSEFLRRARDILLGALEHQEFPFPLLVERLRPERDSSVAPLVQVSFVFQRLQQSNDLADLLSPAPAKGRVTWAGLDVEYYTMPQQEGQFDLELEMTEVSECFYGLFKYDSALFDASTVQRMAGHFIQLLESIGTDPEQTVRRLPLLSQAERSELTAPRANRAKATTHTLVERFEERVAKQPHLIALHDGDVSLSYEELNERANQLAFHLRGHGVNTEVRVGLYIERSVDLVVGLLGILKAGGAYVPIDETYPPDRVAFMLRDADVALTLTSNRFEAALRDMDVTCINVQADWSIVSTESTTNATLNVRPENAAYVIYTSGSTGTPKGVEVTHANVSRLLTTTEHWYRFNSNDVWPLFHSVAFDVSVWELWGALLYGGKLVIVPYSTSRSPDAFYELTVEHGVTVLNQTPSAFVQYIQAEERLGVSPSLRLRLVIFAGEKLEPATLEPWYERHGDATPQLVNMYGITETTVHSTYRPLTHADTKRGASAIGRPLPDLDIYILDGQLEPVPPGVAGELFVGGAGVARGYLNRPELTQARFISNPFSNSPGERLYRSGDLARYLPDGDIEYLGRLDHQVKVRGFRIELGEIESVLCQHAQVKAVVAVVREDRPGDKRIVAYWIKSGTASLAESDLRAHARRHLPEYMLPAFLVELETLPLTVNGKVDRRALPAPSGDRALSDWPLAGPRDSIEQNLVTAWEALLDVRPVGIFDNFFDLGGHSLLAVHLMAEIEHDVGVKLPLATLLQSPTIAELAANLRSTDDLPWSPLVAIKKGGTGTPFFCVAGGGGNVLYFHELAQDLDVDQPIYGLQARGLDGISKPHVRVEDVAAEHLEAIRVVQPEGPYFIGGHCFGGLVAFEMAQQLRRAGDDVAIVAIMDQPAPSDVALDVDEHDDVVWLLRIATALQEATGRELNLPAEDELRPLDADAQLEHLRTRMQVCEMLPPSAGTDQVRGFVEVFKANSLARYNPSQPIPVPVVLFRAAEVHSDYDYAFADDPGVGLERSSMGWQAFASDSVAVHLVPGNHLTMLMKPNVGVLAQRLAACLDECRIAWPTRGREAPIPNEDEGRV